MHDPGKAYTALFAILLFLVLCPAVHAEEAARSFEQHYAERLMIADYQGAVELALERYKGSEGDWHAAYPLANAYLLNFEPSKAAAVIGRYFNNAAAPKPASAYYASATVDCEMGNYGKAYQMYRMAEEAYPDQLMQIKTLRLLCRMKETEPGRSLDAKKRESFKAEVREHLDKTRDMKADLPRAKAILALTVLHDVALAGDYAKDELVVSSLLAKKAIGEEDVIPAATRGFVALFLALSDDKSKAKSLLLCGNSCTANLITLNANDLLYLSRCFAVFGDRASADRALRSLWERMKTDEQKGQFFKYVIEQVDKESKWASLGEAAWIKTEYARHLSGRRK